MKDNTLHYRGFSPRKFLISVGGFSALLLVMFGFLYGFVLDSLRPESIELMRDWHFEGDKSVSSQNNSYIPYTLKDKNTLRITYDLHGVCLLGKRASSLVFVQKGKEYPVSLSQYGKNCYNGEQMIDIPLGHFKGFDVNSRLDKVTASFWYPAQYSITIKKAVAYKAEQNVLGDTVRPDYTKQRKTFSHITPIRPFPYVSRP